MTKRSLRLRAVGLGIAIFLASFPIGFDGELRDNVEAQQSWSLKMVAPLEVGIVCDPRLDAAKMVARYGARKMRNMRRPDRPDVGRIIVGQNADKTTR